MCLMEPPSLSMTSLQEVVGQGAGYTEVLQLDRNGVGLGRTNPDGQIAVGVILAENHHSLVIHRTDPDAVNSHLFH